MDIDTATDSSRPRRGLLRLERLLFFIGIACLAWCGVIGVQAWRYQTSKRLVIENLRATPSPSANVPAAAPDAIAVGEPIGVLEVPRLHLSAVVANGDDDETLRLAVGHLPDTPLPWEWGNSALAGHRDTFFRALQSIRVDDQLRMATAHGDFLYQVTRILIVTPDDISVLAPTPLAALTLVTCFPFSYVGHAPRRFIVQAARADRDVS